MWKACDFRASTFNLHVKSCVVAPLALPVLAQCRSILRPVHVSVDTRLEMSRPDPQDVSPRHPLT